MFGGGALNGRLRLSVPAACRGQELRLENIQKRL